MNQNSMDSCSGDTTEEEYLSDASSDPDRPSPVDKSKSIDERSSSDPVLATVIKEDNNEPGSSSTAAMSGVIDLTEEGEPQVSKIVSPSLIAPKQPRSQEHICFVDSQ